MATTLERRAGIQHRRQQLRLTAVTLAELRALFPILDPTNLDDTVEPWIGATIATVERNHARSVALASTYLSVVDTAPTIALPEVSRDAVATSLRVTGPVRIEKTIRLGAPLEQYLSVVERETARAAARHASNGARDLITRHVNSRTNLRWRRLTSSKACDFCVMLAGRGAVYHSRETGGFRAHDGCACYPVAEKVSS